MTTRFDSPLELQPIVDAAGKRGNITDPDQPATRPVALRGVR